MLALIMLPLLAFLLTGCIVYAGDDHYHHPHYWYH
jgi:hypothetical protein